MAHRLLALFKNYALPIAILLGIVLHRPLVEYHITDVTPYMIVLMLFFSFLKISIRDIHFSPYLFGLTFLQIALAMGSYYLIEGSGLPYASVWAQGIMICFLCPTASASPVVTGLLGGEVATATSFVLLNTLIISLLSPLLLGLVSDTQLPLLVTAWAILKRIAPIVLTPLILSELLRRFFSSWHRRLLKIPLAAFWVWVITLTLIMAKTFHFVFQEPRSMAFPLLVLALLGGVGCLVQFFLGKVLGIRLMGEPVTLGQGLGQKNSTIGIWMVHSFLNPVASVAMAAYSIWQNLFNSWQLIRKEKHSSHHA